MLTDKRTEKENAMFDLKNKLRQNKIDGCIEYFVKIPLEKSHCHPLIGAARKIHSDIKIKITELVKDGITNVKVIKKMLRKHVAVEYAFDLVKPLPSDRAYYPLNKDILNCVHMAIHAGRHSQIDQVQLEHLVERWTKENDIKNEHERTRFYFRKATEAVSSDDSKVPIIQKPGTQNKFSGDMICDSDDEDMDTEDDEDSDGELYTSNSFIFVHQEPWQQHLLIRYGNILALLDATYKTTKYSLPLFLLCVRSNAGYIPVAEFIVEQETCHHIAEALRIISLWNPQWKPPCFMIDYSESELNGILTVFPESEVYLCEFHREQCWTRWARNSKFFVQKN